MTPALDLPPALLAQLEARAAETRCTLSETVTLLCLEALERHAAPPAPCACADDAPARRLRWDSGDADFEAWWAAYPKRVGKRAAHAAWRATRAERPPLEEMLLTLGAQTHSRAWTADRGQYVVDPERYLKRGRWADDIEGMNLGTDRHLDELARRGIIPDARYP